MSEKIFTKKNYFFASSSNDRGISLDDKKKRIMLTEIPEVKFIRYMRSQLG